MPLGNGPTDGNELSINRFGYRGRSPEAVYTTTGRRNLLALEGNGELGLNLLRRMWTVRSDKARCMLVFDTSRGDAITGRLFWIRSFGRSRI